MDRSSYAFHPLSQQQYQTIVSLGSFANTPSPMLNKADYDSLIAVMKDADIDPRLPLAFVWSEGHMGTDPGLVAASVNNFGGIKYSSAAGTTDSGIPADTGGTYAAFPDLSFYWREWVRIMNNSIIGPDFAAGNLIGVVEHYTNGVGTGHNKVDQYNAYVRDYPPEGSAPVTDGVYGEDLIAKFSTQIGHSTSGDYDPRNGDHPWAYYCEAGVESTGRNCGLDVTPRASAIAKYNACNDQGLIVQGTPEHGAQCFFGLAFYSPDGHTGLWDADKGMLLGTLTDGSGVGYRSWGPGTVGYLGSCRIPGVVGDRRPAVVHPPMDNGNLVIPGTPGNDARAIPDRVGVGGAMRRVWEMLPEPLVALGFPLTNEYQATVVDEDGTTHERTVQEFQRTTLIYQPELAVPWNCVWALRSQKITKKAA